MITIKLVAALGLFVCWMWTKIDWNADYEPESILLG